MSRTVTALYDTREEAEAARERLSSAVSLDSVRIINKESGAGGSGRSALGDLYMSHDDRQAYDEGIRRGGYLLCAHVDSHEDADRIVALLEETASVDFEQRQQGWRTEGWSPQAAPASASAGAGAVVSEERIPVVEEELRVGKREVERGGARVRSYVREVPVQEQVTLKEEHVEVERRPVNQATPVSPADAAALLQERTVEMRETAEEAVVQKVASVKEEVVVRKTAQEHTEEIVDTVRHTEVDVEKGAGTHKSPFGFGSGSADEGSERIASEETTRR